MAEKILNDSDFEELKLYEDSTQTHKIASEQIKKIFSRLFQGTEVNPDGFYFTAFESESPNAFFISAKHTLNNQRVIAVSPSLIKECKNEAELAGIIAHECGHYLWSELLGGKNSIFQERAADLRAVDLLINGGYNPLNHREVCKRILAYGRSYSDVTLDVHGNGLARVEDIDARLTMIANERGNFAPLTDKPDEEYLKFQKELLDAYEKEGYDTYYDKIFKQKYGTKDIEKLDPKKILVDMLEDITKNPDNPPVRYRDFFDKISSIKMDAFKDKDEQFTTICQQIITKLHEIEVQLQNPLLKTKLNFNEIFSIRRMIDEESPKLLRRFQLDLFGDFLTQQKNVENFVNYKTPEEALHWAKEIEKLKYTEHYFQYFNDDDKNKFDRLYALKEENIGKKLPWVELEDYHYTLESTEDRNILRRCIRKFHPSDALYNEEYPVKSCYHIKSWQEDELTEEGLITVDKKSTQNGFIAEDYYLEGKIVTAYGEEAQKLNRDKERIKALNRHIERCKSNFKVFNENLNILNCIARFDKAQTDDEKMAIINQLLGLSGIKELFQDSIISHYDPSYKYNFKHPYIEKIIEQYNQSEFKEHFIGLTGQDELVRRSRKKYLYDEEQKHTPSVSNKEYYQIEAIRAETNFNMLPDTTITIAKSTLNLCEYLEKICNATEDENKRHVMAEYINGLYHALSTIDLRADLAAAKDEQGDIIKSKKTELEDKVETNKRILHQLIKRSISKSKGLISKDRMDYYMREDFLYNEKSWFMENILKTMDLPTTKDVSELMDVVYKKMDLPAPINYYKETIPSPLITDLQDPEEDRIAEMRYFWEYAGITIIADKLRYDDNFDIVKIMDAIRDCNDNNSELIRDIFAKAINKKDAFNSLSLKEKLYVYEAMEQKKLFSEKYANKQEFFKAIVKDIKECKNENLKEQYAEGILRGKYLEYGGRNKKDVEFARQKDELIDIYTDILAQKLGKDDGSDEYLQKATELADKLLKKDSNTDGSFPRSTIQSMFRRISDKVVSQELTAQMFNEKGATKISGQDAEEYDYAARLAEGLISFLAKSPEMAKATIDLLSSKLTEESMDTFFATLKKTTGYKRGDVVQGMSLDTASIQLAHENFWYADLPVRAYMMNKLLSAYSKNDDDLLNLVVDMHFDANSPYRKDAERVVKAVYNNLEPYERKLILAALVSANQKGDDNTSGGEAIGEGLKMFFENKGPAFVKFGQLLSYLPTLDKDIRKPLAKLRDKADIPDRAQLFQYLKETLPDEELAKIGRVDKILGAGSFFITAKVEYEGKDRVVAVMRPHAKEVAQSGMDMINQTIEELSTQDSKYKPLKNIAEQARLSAMSETDIDKDYNKYREAVEMYDNLKIITPKGEFEPEVAKWCSYGSGKDGQVYKIMDMSEGQALTSTKLTEQEKHDMAIAYTTVELANLLSGEKWDTDRHQGQQNFEQKDFNRFIIGIFDTGARMLKSPKTKDKVLLGEMLYGMIRSARLGRSVADYMVDKVKSIDKAGNALNFDTLYIDEVQRGLTALSDIMTYQKEVKDEKGNIIQEEKSLTSEELSNIATAILDSGIMDKKIKRTLAAKVVLNKLRPWRKGWAQSLTEGIKKMTSSITIVSKENKEPIQEIKRKDKPQSEIYELQTNTSKKRKLGVSLKYINQSGYKKSKIAMAALKER